MGDRRATPYVEAGRLLCRGWAVARGRLPTPLHTRLSRVCREGGPLDSSSFTSAGDWLDYISRVRRSQKIHSHSRSRVYRQVPLYHNRYRGRERHSSADAIGDGAALRREPRDGAKVQARSGPQRDQRHPQAPLSQALLYDEQCRNWCLGVALEEAAELDGTGIAIVAHESSSTGTADGPRWVRGTRAADGSVRAHA